MKKLLFLLAFLATSYSYAQEVGKCGDGIDNDGDGFVDCYDSECYSDNLCADFFIGKDASCEAKPDTFPPFTMHLKYTSNKGTHHPNRLIIGDVDSDNVPEIVTTYRGENAADFNTGANPTSGFINIFQPILGSSILNLENPINIAKDGFYPTYEDIAMADIDNDKSADIFVLIKDVVQTGTDKKGNPTYTNYFKVMAYDSKTGTKKWASPIDFGTNAPPTYGIADFDGDGLSEFYAKAQIFDAHTGKLMGSAKGIFSNGPIAADINSTSPGLELILGCYIYGVSINRAALTATLTLLDSNPHYFTRGTSSQTSVADFNQDGHLDVLAVGSYDKPNDNTTIFFWDVFNKNLKYYNDPANWSNGAGRLNLADIDGDTLMNIVYVTGSNLVALKEVTTGTGLDQLWRDAGVVENTSGYTGCTLFDFNADGKSEIVYRDEEYLYIYTSTQAVGATPAGFTKTQQVCKSRTAFEYPIVADVDNDGHAEICVTCAVSGASGDPAAAGKALSLFDDAQIRVFESGDPINAPWVPARKVWNQHGYFIVNVNDNLTIPTHQQLSEKVFSGNAPCRGGGKNRPFNSFLNQAPYTNTYGCPQYAAPNLTYLAGSLVINAPTCPDKDFTISLTIKNLGNKNITGNVPVSFYNKNPFKAGATLYNTVKVGLSNLIPGGTYTTSSLTVKGNGSADSLYIVLNDAGTTLPTPIKLPNTAFIECDYNNGIPAYVTPKPVPMTTVTTDDLQCNGSLPHTGTATASVVINAIDRSNEFDFYWSDGNTAKPVPADFKGKTYTQRAAGTYTVFGVHKVASCGTTTVQATVNLSPAKDPDVDVYVVQDDNNCSVPNGILKAVVNDTDKDGVGDPASKFTFAWYKTSEFLTGTIVSTSDTARVLLPVPYTVLVTDKTTGCFNNGKPKTVGDARPKMKISVVPTPINCSALPTGTLTATLTVNGAAVSNTSGYQFNWYNGKKVKPGTPDYSTQNLSGLNANDYTLFVFDQSGSQCVSDTVTSTITKTLPPVILSTNETHKQTSCQVGVANGAAEVVVDDVTKYTYQWYNGQNTQAANKIPGATSSTVSGLAKGIYTIQITEITTNCSSSAEVTIDEDTAPIVITTSAISNSSCSPKNGSITISGVPASGSTLADYTFFLDNGTTTAQQSGNNVFSNLDQGTYNVWAFNNVTKCQTTVKQQAVGNAIPVVMSTPSVVQAAADCKNGLGTLSVSSSGSGNNFKFDWYKGGDTTGVSLFNETGTSSTFITKYGNYSIKIEDLSNHCKTVVQQFLPVANSHSLSTLPTDLDKCAPLLGGSVDATLTITTTVPAITYTQADYVIDVYQGSDDPDAGDTGSPAPMTSIATGGAAVTQAYTLANVYDAGFYTFVATCRKPGAPTDGCRVSSTVNLRRITTNPVINNTVTDNIKCAPKDGGEIDLTLGVNPGVDDDPNDYDFIWTGLPAGNIGGTNGEKAINLAPNTYTVTATFKATVKNGGCSSTKTIPVLDVPQLIALPPLTPTAVTHCDPANGLAPNAEGAAAVTQLTVDGSTINAPFPAAYTFAWSNGAMTSSVSGLVPNTYNVVVTNTNTGCTQSADVTIDDKTINTVGVDLVKFRNEVHCVDPQKGMLRVAGTTPGTNTNGYSYNWYDGNAIKAAPDYATTLDSLNNLSFNQPITVKVVNLDNNCWAVGTYTLGETIIPIRISANSTPITQCDNILLGTAEDGSLYSTVILPTTKSSGPVDPVTDFNYVWEFNGTDKYFTKTVSNLKLSDVQGEVIKVRAIDKLDADARCVSDIIQVFIEDEQSFPAVVGTAVLPVTNCNLNPNGSAAASVNGDIINYSFDWYEGAITPSSNSFHVGPDVDSLKAYLSPDNVFYTVLATNIFTGCTNTDTVAIKFVPGKLQDPTITVLADQTSCDLTNPNGSLGADVGGNTSAYQFTWTKVGDASFGSKVQPIITDLIDCTNCYNVVAVDTATGCQSTKNGSIVFKPVYPDFNLAVIDATCSNDDGYAAVFIINEEPITIKSIEWFIDGELVASGNADYNAVASDNYKVVVTTDMNCIAEKTFSIRPEVHPHNGISRNNDDKNTHFHIDCIDNYPGNIVRIYNRIGTLVYEATDYNNLDISFDGKSNKGISMMGTNLPDGTYFYIIDKRNGSKQLAGYLEIVN